MNVDSTFNGCDHWNPYVGEVFQYLNALVVHLAPNAGIGDVAEGCKIEVRNEFSAGSRQDYDLVRSILRDTVKGIDKLRMVLRRENERPAGAWAASCSSPSPMASVPSVRVGPGLTALTRTPLGPYSAAQVLVSRLMAALLEP